MLLDSRTLSGKDNFQAKFLRIGNEVYIIGLQDKISFHIELARKEKILERIEQLKSQNPDMLDGGILYVNDRIIKIGGVSTTLSLPLNENARKQTIKVLKHKYPSFSVKELSEK